MASGGWYRPAWTAAGVVAARALSFDGHVGMYVGVGGADVGVPEPQGDDGGVHPCPEHVHGAGVAELVVRPISA
jgi:hypothetical protein